MKITNDTKQKKNGSNNVWMDMVERQVEKSV